MLSFTFRTFTRVACDLGSLFFAVRSYNALVADAGAGVFGILCISVMNCATCSKDLRRWIELCSLMNETAALPPPDKIGSQCVICKCAMTEHDLKMLPCGDCLHADCMMEWAFQRPDCPVCKADLRDLTSVAPISGFWALVRAFFALTAPTRRHRHVHAHPAPMPQEEPERPPEFEFRYLKRAPAPEPPASPRIAYLQALIQRLHGLRSWIRNVMSKVRGTRERLQAATQ
jgi:hypothetical protein